MSSESGPSGREKPSGIAKWFMQSPKWLYRARLGFVFGQRFLLLEHKGRKSGNRYQTPLEVAYHNPETDEYVVTSGRESRQTGTEISRPIPPLPSGSGAAGIRQHSDSSRPKRPLKS